MVSVTTEILSVPSANHTQPAFRKVTWMTLCNPCLSSCLSPPFLVLHLSLNYFLISGKISQSQGKPAWSVFIHRWASASGPCSPASSSLPARMQSGRTAAQVRSERPWANQNVFWGETPSVYDQLCLPGYLSLGTPFAAPFENIWRLLASPSLSSAHGSCTFPFCGSKVTSLRYLPLRGHRPHRAQCSQLFSCW